MDKYDKKILKDSTVIGIFAFVAVVILVSCGIPKIFHDIRETAVNAVLSRLDSAFNPDFHDEEYIKEQMEIIFPNIEFVSHEIVQTKMYDTVDSIDSVSSSDLDIKHVYCFNNKGVEFTVEEYKMIGWLGERDLMHENDYIKHLGEYFTKEKICENSDKINSEKIEVVNGDYELDFVYYVNSYEEIPPIYKYV